MYVYYIEHKFCELITYMHSSNLTVVFTVTVKHSVLLLSGDSEIN